jgi:mRNA interferase MazF
MEIYRGDIFYIRKGGQITGSEQDAGRPVVIVSNNTGNYHSDIVEVVPLTTQEKKPLPTHVEVLCHVPSTALCECIQNVSQERLGEYIRSCTDAEMDAIDKALMVSLGLDSFDNDSYEKAALELVNELKAKLEVVAKENEQLKASANQNSNEEAIKLLTERDLYKNLYEQLFERLVK